MIESSPPRQRLASLSRRLGSLVYELLILAALSLFIGFVLLPWAGAGTNARALAPPDSRTRLVLLAALLVACGGYCLWFWTGGRTTLAMRTWQLRLATVGGQPLAWHAAAVRYLACWLGPALVFLVGGALPAGSSPWPLGLLALGFAWALVDPERQFLHDRLARTRVFDARSVPRRADPPLA